MQEKIKEECDKIKTNITVKKISNNACYLNQNGDLKSKITLSSYLQILDAI